MSIDPIEAHLQHIDVEVLRLQTAMVTEFSRHKPDPHLAAQALTVCCLLAQATDPNLPAPRMARRAVELAVQVALQGGWYDLDLQQPTPDTPPPL